MSRGSNKLRILLADDHDLVRRGIRGLLRSKRGWMVVGEAADGRDAVKKAKELKPNIAILDIEMPELDGIEATRQIRDVSPNTKVVVLTMHASDQIVRRVLEAGARGYVLKSDIAEELVNAVSDVSRGKVFLTADASEIVLQGFMKTQGGSKQGQDSQSRPTPREVQIIRLLAQGKVSKEIAEALGITVRTVGTHRAKIMLKLGLHSLAELINYAIRNDIASKDNF